MFFRKPYGYGYDDALVAAAAVLMMLDRNPGRSLSDLKTELGAPLAVGAGICTVQQTFARIFNLGAEFATDGSQFDRLLQDGDYLRVGNCLYRYLAGGNIEAEYHEEIYRLTILDGLDGWVQDGQLHALGFVDSILVPGTYPQ